MSIFSGKCWSFKDSAVSCIVISIVVYIYYHCFQVYFTFTFILCIFHMWNRIQWSFYNINYGNDGFNIRYGLQHLCLCVCVCLSVCVSVCLLSFCLSVCLFIYLSVYLNPKIRAFDWHAAPTELSGPKLNQLGTVMVYRMEPNSIGQDHVKCCCWVGISLAANFLCFHYVHPKSELISGYCLHQLPY